MIYNKFLTVISTTLLINFSNSNASSFKQEFFSGDIADNIQHDQQYWNEWLPVIKCDAKETLRDRFEYCTNWLINLLESKPFYNKIIPFNYEYDYDIKDINDVIDIKKLKEEIAIRKILLDDIEHKCKLNGNAWSEIPLIINGYNKEHQRKIGSHLQWDCRLLHNHWSMSFDRNYDNIKLNFYPSYEYQEPAFYLKTLNSEKTLSICLSGIEMDLLTSNNSTSNTDLFANYLINRKDNQAATEIARYQKYFTKEQNALLASHIISYYLSFKNDKKQKVAKYLLENYILKDLFKSMKPKQFLSYVKNVKTDDWYEVIISKYLDNEFGTEYNKSYLSSLKKMTLQYKKEFENIVLPMIRKYTTVIFNKLVTKHNNLIAKRPNNDDDIVRNRIKALFAAGTGNGRIIDNVMSYVKI